MSRLLEAPVQGPDMKPRRRKPAPVPFERIVYSFECCGRTWTVQGRPLAPCPVCGKEVLSGDVGRERKP